MPKPATSLDRVYQFHDVNAVASSIGGAGLDLPPPLIGIKCDQCGKELIRRSPDEPIACRIVKGKRICVRCV